MRFLLVASPGRGRAHTSTATVAHCCAPSGCRLPGGIHVLASPPVGDISMPPSHEGPFPHFNRSCCLPPRASRLKRPFPRLYSTRGHAPASHAPPAPSPAAACHLVVISPGGSCPRPLFRRWSCPQHPLYASPCPRLPLPAATRFPRYTPGEPGPRLQSRMGPCRRLSSVMGHTY